MPGYYYDTSAVAKYYFSEDKADSVARFLDDPQNTNYISRLATVEIKSAFARDIRVGEATPAEYDLFEEKFTADVDKRKIVVINVLVRHFKSAEFLIEKYGFKSSLKTLDAVQLSVAIDLKEKVSVNYFVCADKNLCKIANKEGFEVINPSVE